MTTDYYQLAADLLRNQRNKKASFDLFKNVCEEGLPSEEANYRIHQGD